MTSFFEKKAIIMAKKIKKIPSNHFEAAVNASHFSDPKFVSEVLKPSHLAFEKLLKAEAEQEKKIDAQLYKEMVAKNELFAKAVKMELSPEQQAAEVSEFLKAKRHVSAPGNGELLENIQLYPPINHGVPRSSCERRIPVYDTKWTHTDFKGLGSAHTSGDGYQGNLNTLLIAAPPGGEGLINNGCGVAFYSGNQGTRLTAYAHFNTWGDARAIAIIGYGRAILRLRCGIYSVSNGEWLDNSYNTLCNESAVFLDVRVRNFNYLRTTVSASANIEPNKWYYIYGWTVAKAAGILNGGGRVDVDSNLTKFELCLG
jgi:hypothetical protein